MSYLGATDTELQASSAITSDDPIDVTSDKYGAVGDGTTDDTAAIESAINDVTNQTASAGTIHFPPGTYYCDTADRIIPDTGVGFHLQGSGWNRSVIKTDSDDRFLHFGQNQDYVLFEGLTFTNDSGDPASDTGEPMITGGDVDRCHFDRCHFRDIDKQAVSMAGADRVWMDQSYMENIGRGGFVVPSSSIRLRCTNSYFERTGDDAIALNGDSQNCIVANNIVYRGGALKNGSGIKVHGDQVVVIGNSVTRSNAFGIVAKHSGSDASTGEPPKDVIIADNVVDRLETSSASANTAIQVRELTDNPISITGNVIKPWDVVDAANGGQENVRSIQVRNRDNPSNVHISDNMIWEDSTQSASTRQIEVKEGEINLVKITDNTLLNGSTALDVWVDTKGGNIECKDNYFEPDPSEASRFCRFVSTGAGVDDLLFEGTRVLDPNNNISNFAVLNDVTIDTAEWKDNRLGGNMGHANGVSNVGELMTGMRVSDHLSDSHRLEVSGSTLVLVDGNDNESVKIADDVTIAASGGSHTHTGTNQTGDGMTADPESATEDGYLQIDIGTNSYQIPIYSA